MTRCATIDCRETARHKLVWLESNMFTEPICDDCAESYERRTQHGKAFRVVRNEVTS